VDFWVVAPSVLPPFSLHFNPEDGGSIYLRNVCIKPPH